MGTLVVPLGDLPRVDGREKRMTYLEEQFNILKGKIVKGAELLKDRSDVQCLHRWQKVLNPNLVKGPWTKDVRISLLSHSTAILYIFMSHFGFS